MPADVGEMFYYGEVPWHGLGRKVEHPLKFDEAIIAGGLDWEVEKINLETAEYPPSPVTKRIAIVRNDKAPGDRSRVLGVAHRDFRPLQNREGAKIFDSVFGKGKAVYHTGGYLGYGEVVWLLAKLPKEIKVTASDIVQPYALFSNSHDGSIAIDFRLTTVRVVCQNTLSLALRRQQDANTFFKRAHQGSYVDLETELESHFNSTLKGVDDLEERFKAMMDVKFSKTEMEDLIMYLFPNPKKPATKNEQTPVFKAYMTRIKNLEKGRNIVRELKNKGKGTDIRGVRDSLWGGLNAVLEYVDHYQNGRGGLATGLFGQKVILKKKAFEKVLEFLPKQLRQF